MPRPTEMFGGVEVNEWCQNEYKTMKESWFLYHYCKEDGRLMQVRKFGENALIDLEKGSFAFPLR